MKGKKQEQFTAAEMAVFKAGAERICGDFEVYCKYMIENQVKLSLKTGNIGKKDCFKINQLLSWREDYEKDTCLQDGYAILDFFLCFAFRLDILAKGSNGKSGIYTERGRNYDTFTGMSQTARYLSFFSYLLADYFTDRAEYEDAENYREMELLLELCAASVSGTLVTLQQIESILMCNAHRYSKFLRIFQIMNICDTKFISKPGTARVYGMLTVESITVQEMGNLAGRMYESCRIKNGRKWVELLYQGNLLKHYIETFGSNFVKEECKVMSGLLEEEEKTSCQQVCKLEIRLRGFECRRTIRIDSSATLEDIHDYIQKLYDFDDDHMYCFTIGNGREKIEFFRSGTEEGNSADEVTLGELGLFRGQTFTYLFDFGDCWEFTIKVKDIQDGTLKQPEILSAVGDPPKQYPEWPDEDWE